MTNIANSGDDHGIYLWRDPRRNGYPIAESDIEPLISFAKNKGIKRILYDNWGTGKKQTAGSEAGSGLQSGYFLENLISSAHDHDVLVEALYTDNHHFSDVIKYNMDNKNKFDGIRMNYEGPWNLGPMSHSNEFFYEPITPEDIGYFATSKNLVGYTSPSSIPVWVKNIAKWWSQGATGDDEFINTIQYLIREKIIHVESMQKKSSTSSSIPQWIKNNAGWWADGTIDDKSFLQCIQFLIKDGIIRIPSTSVASPLLLYASISWHWGRVDVDNPDQPIEYDGKQKFAYQHILDIVDGVDIQTAWGGANAVDAILFRVSPIIKYAREITKPAWITIETSDQAPANQTFADEGMDNLESTTKALLSALKSNNNSPAGIIYHFYMNTYG